ncbi:hypothetical protein LB467_14285 [Salegentibacter sp. JZCK2]|uniref:hypothetical protein n=1 Tax=Salegentibacter tibetensis TaxID=2873600 RepID=UPI001CCD2BB4|nr:hypothetical protein [Salegentibacter tibetensis]MBZ9730860.1 hypothetical protein [Salegentibacter tibetensis]
MNRNSSSIFFLILMVLLIVPWEGICSAHLLHPEHHDKDADKPSICDLRRNYTDKEAVVWPPMDCENQELITGSFEKPTNDKQSISSETILLAAIILNVAYLPPAQKSVESQEILYHNLAPPAAINPLRGPPSTFFSQKV